MAMHKPADLDDLMMASGAGRIGVTADGSSNDWSSRFR